MSLKLQMDLRLALVTEVALRLGNCLESFFSGNNRFEATPVKQLLNPNQTVVIRDAIEDQLQLYWKALV